MTGLVLYLLGLALFLVAETAAYQYARYELGMPRPWYWGIPGAGFVLLYIARRSKDAS